MHSFDELRQYLTKQESYKRFWHIGRLTLQVVFDGCFQLINLGCLRAHGLFKGQKHN